MLSTSLRFCVLRCALACVLQADEPHTLHTFERQQLTDEYYSEGAHAGDLNNDGHSDVVYGPYWFAGPDFQQKHEIYAPKPQNREFYADHFFAWIHDLNGDGWKDIFVVGFPGTPAYVYENPGPDGFEQHWPKHQVFDSVSNESPHFVNLVGDETPELVCTRDGFFGFATIDPAQPFSTWKFHPISDQFAARKFGHGLGVGDLNGDGRLDVIHAGGWLEQPPESPLTSRWQPHEVAFTDSYGGAEMFAYDVDGDGDQDVITSLAAHDFGLAWYEQVPGDANPEFRQHVIMGAHPAENRYGVVFSEPHSLNLADIDGDGLKDIVTGKTYYSHHKASPLWDAGAVVYWFRLVRGPDGVDWVPDRADDKAGIGRQVSLVDLEGDGLLDIVLGGMVGAHVLHHRQAKVNEAAWQAAQPKRYSGPPKPSADGAESRRGPKPARDQLAGALEAESLEPSVPAGQFSTQSMSSFKTDVWSKDAQLFWSGGRPGDSLKLKLPERSGPTDLDIVLTCAGDYGVIQLVLDDQPLGKPIDLYESQVVTTGILTFTDLDLKPGPHTLSLQILGANPKATPSHLVGVDWLRLRESSKASSTR